MSHLGQVVLADDKALVGKSLHRPLNHFRSGTPLPANDEDRARFKKKEKLETQPKSILKHRIQTLTGVNMVELETQLGFDLLKDGITMGVEDMRRLAHLLILEANGQLDDIKSPPKLDRKRKVTETVSDTNKRAKVLDRRSLPTSLAPGSKALRGRRSVAPSALPSIEEREQQETEEEEDEEEEEEDPNLGMDNPTPQMLALKRKSLARTATASPSPRKSPRKSPRRASKAVSTPITLTPTVTRKNPAKTKRGISSKLSSDTIKEEAEPKTAFTGKSYKDSDGKEQQSKVYFLRGDPSKISYGRLKRKVPEFPGCNLAVLHTPIQWEPTDVFSVVQSIRLMNREAGQDFFVVLVGCGVSNVHMFREALSRQTRHVQLIVFEREDQNKEPTDEQRGKLRETTSFFLLAYFFPGAEQEGSKLPIMMVREGFTTCLRTTCVEDLENTILHVLSETGDWLLDLAPRRRELTLAAQKTGRYAIAIDEDLDELAVVAKRSRSIAEVMDEDGFDRHDGIISTL